VKAKFKSNKTLEDTRAQGPKAPRDDELVDMLQLPSKEWVTLRAVGPIVPKRVHWIPVSLQEAEEISSGKKKGRIKSFPKTCLAFNPETEERDSTKECPYCEIESEHVRDGTDYFQNFIVRSLQEDEPKKKGTPTKSELKSGFKEKGSKLWTPVRVFRMTSSLTRDLKSYAASNRHKDKKTGEKKAFPLTHPKYGRDIQIYYDPDEKVASKRYRIQLGDKSPLTEEELEYALWNIEALNNPESLKDAKKELEGWLKRNKKNKGKSKDDDDDIDDEDDVDNDDDSDDDDDKPSKNSKKGKSKSKDDDDEDDDLDDDDDDDETPKKGKKSKKSDDDDEDEDEDDDLDDDDEEDETPKKGKKGKSGKGSSKKSRDDDDDDLDDDEDEDESDDEDEDDEEETPKKGKKAKKDVKAKKGKKSKSDDDDDDDLDDDLDDDDDLDEDEDDDEEEKPKKGKKASKSKKGKSKKSKSKDDDDDDDDLDDDDEDD
jgi:hypothetical protein